jgi:hypothetical protein
MRSRIGLRAGLRPASRPADPSTDQERGPRTQPGAQGGLYAPEQHALYDGRFVISGARVYQVGTLSDRSPWDHMGDDASNVRPVDGTIEVDVDERANTGTFRADLALPEGLTIPCPSSRSIAV